MSKKVITEDIDKQISEMRKQSISVEKIARILNLNPGSLKIYLYRKSYRKEWNEAKDICPLDDFCPTGGFSPEKIKLIIDVLKRVIDKYKSLLIIGYQHCEEIVDLMKKYKKYIIVVDCREQAFGEDKSIKTYRANANGQKFKNILDEIKLNYPNVAVYNNLTGRKKLIGEVYKRDFYPIITVASERPGRNQKISAAEKCRELGATTYKLSRNMKLAVSE